jgi:hypothetical protein
LKSVSKQSTERAEGYQAKIELAASFGTKKNKQKVKNIELNKVNMDGLANLKDALVETIEENTADLPTQGIVTKSTVYASTHIVYFCRVPHKGS